MEDFTNDELFALEEYTGPRFEIINTLLTADDLSVVDFDDYFTDIDKLESLIRLCVDLYTAILKYSISNDHLLNEVYRGVSIRGLERIKNSNQLSRFVSTSTDFDSTLDSYGNPEYNRIFLRFNLENVPCLIVSDLYKDLLQQGRVEQRTYYSCFGESEAILLPFTRIINLEQNELYTGISHNGTKVCEMPIYDVTLCSEELEQLSDEDETELGERISSKFDDARVAYNNLLSSKDTTSNEDLQKYSEFIQLIIEYLKSRFARIDEKFNYSRKGGILIK